MTELGRRAFAIGGALALGACAWVRPRRANAQPAAPETPQTRETLDATKLDALLADVARARKTVKTLRADFTQERRLTLLATTVRSTGRLAFVAPDRLRWELAPPDDIVYWIGPEGLSYRTRSSGATVPAQGANVGRALADLRALVGGDLAQLRERYVLSATRGPNDVAIEGAAKDAPGKTSVRAFTLVLDKGLVLPVRARLLEGKSDAIDVVFTNATANAPVDPALMRAP